MKSIAQRRLRQTSLCFEDEMQAIAPVAPDILAFEVAHVWSSGQFYALVAK